jgi:FkbM family methyltransferase
MADRGATVYAFEPNPYAFAALSERFADAPNVHCLNRAVSDRAGKMRLFLHHRAAEDQVKWAAGCSLFVSKGNVRADTYEMVEAVDLDQFIANLPKPVSLLKLDVEGAEVAILRRMIASGGLEQIEHVLAEMHDTKIPELREEGAALRDSLTHPRFAHVRLDWD